MKKQKFSGAAVFIYTVIALTAVIAAVCFGLYYTDTAGSGIVLWTGIVSFMILYHFGLRILFSKITDRIRFDYNKPFFQPKAFEKKLYKLLKVRKWKDKVLTFNPEAYNFQKRTPHQLATTMAKSETDHWINECLSLLSIFFFLIWGAFPVFLIQAIAAMLFDAHFIVVQRYNRPIVIKLMEKMKKRGDIVTRFNEKRRGNK